MKALNLYRGFPGEWPTSAGFAAIVVNGTESRVITVGTTSDLPSNVRVTTQFWDRQMRRSKLKTRFGCRTRPSSLRNTGSCCNARRKTSKTRRKTSKTQIKTNKTNFILDEFSPQPYDTPGSVVSYAPVCEFSQLPC